MSHTIKITDPSKPLWIFIHGFAANKSFWDSSLRYLKCNYITIDLPGHGDDKLKFKGGNVLEFITYNTFKQLDTLIEKNPFKKVILVGHSLGAYLVGKYELVHPDLSCCNILIGAPNNLKKNIKNIMMFKLAQNAIKDIKELPPDQQKEQLTKFLHSKSFLSAYKGLEILSKKNKTAQEAKRTIDNWIRLDFNLLASLIELLPNLDIMPILKDNNYKKRTLFLAGQKDKYVNIKRIRQLSLTKDWLFVKQVKRAPHFLPTYYPKKFANILKYWIGAGNV